jgi:hypothetical protein
VRIGNPFSSEAGNIRRFLSEEIVLLSQPLSQRLSFQVHSEMKSDAGQHPEWGRQDIREIF